MKLTRFIFIIITAAASLSISARSYKFVAGNDSLETKICIAAAQNDVKKYRNAVKELPYIHTGNRLQKIVVNNLDCNNLSIFKFARNHRAMETVAYMSKFVKTSVIIRRNSSAPELPDLKNFNDDSVIIVTAN